MQPGELRTKIRIQKLITTGTGSFKTAEWVDIDSTLSTEPAKYIMAKWDGAFGSRAYIANSVQAQRPANVTIRYRDDITEQHRVVYDGINYNIISPHDPDQHKQWLVFDVKAMVNA